MPKDPAPPTPPRGIYPIIDADACEKRSLDLVECARAILDADPPVVQLRAKGRPAGLVQEWAESIASRLPPSGPRLIINDRADIAASVEAFGVHVGQEDLPASELIRCYPSLHVGLSTHDEVQLGEALDVAGLHYVALGPIFPTDSKERAEPPLSLGRLQAAFERTRRKGVPLVAIGGMTEERLPEVSRACDLVAAIGMVLPESRSSGAYTWIRERCVSLDRAIRGETIG